MERVAAPEHPRRPEVRVVVAPAHDDGGGVAGERDGAALLRRTDSAGTDELFVLEPRELRHCRLRRQQQNRREQGGREQTRGSFRLQPRARRGRMPRRGFGSPMNVVCMCARVIDRIEVSRATPIPISTMRHSGDRKASPNVTGASFAADNRRKRGSTRCHTEKMSMGKIHEVPPQ